MKVLVINSGSSSIKYRLFDMIAGMETASGVLERIGEIGSRLIHRSSGPAGAFCVTESIATHRIGLDRIGLALRETADLVDTGILFGIGHRVVHGGSVFQAPVIISAAVTAAIHRLIPLAPLHNPANLAGIQAAMATAPGVPQVAVFDTAFHHTIGPEAFNYALPRSIAAAHGIRRYGFHGTSHAYVAGKAAEFLNQPLDSLNLITLHLGNGASAAAIKSGRCMDTSMGMTPLEGLIMGERGGDLDPGALIHLLKQMGGDPAALDRILNRESGLKGICGENDMREVMRLAESGDQPALLAVDMVAHRIKKYIGAYHAIIGGADAVVFTGGIGENTPEIRRRACDGLAHLGLRIDPQINLRCCQSGVLAVHAAGSPVAILVVRTNEELAIAQQTVACIRSTTAR